MSARGGFGNVGRWIGQIRGSRLFWAVLALKLAAAGMFSGWNYAHLFVPFIEAFVRHPLDSPYDAFWAAHRPDAFPYGPVMLAAVSLPRLALAMAGVQALPLHALLFVDRLPVLLADLAILLVLGRWLRQRVHRVLWLYWANPVLFYINYLHGQLDVLPMGFTLIAAYYLFSGRPGRSAALLGLAVATKAHMVLILPFALIWLWQEHRRWRPVLRYAGIAIAVMAALLLPFLASHGFVQMVFLNAQQDKVLALALPAGGLRLYPVPAVIVVLLCAAWQMRIGNRDLFVLFLGAAYGALLLFIPPAPGWYYWVMPWFVYFYARIDRAWLAAFALLHLAYFAYFAVIPGSDYLTLWPGADGGSLAAMAAARGIDPAMLANLAFTLLQTALLVNCALVFDRGVRRPQRSRLRARPYMLGIAGDSGSGKTTLAEALQHLFGPTRLDVICGDDMHRWQRGDERWQDLTHLDPRANELHAELDYLKALRRNRRIQRRHYDHDTGQFAEAVAIDPRPVIVYEGLHTFYLRSARELYDLRLFVRPDPVLVTHRKIVRDMARRNYTKAEVIAAIAARADDSARYIAAQAQHADLVVAILLATTPEDQAIGTADARFAEQLQLTLSNEFFLDPLLADLAAILPDGVHHHYDGNDRQVIVFDEALTAGEVQVLGERHVTALEHLGLYDPGWLDGWSGLVQLFTAYCMFHGWERDDD